MNSYQKRKQELAYYKQRCKALGKIISEMVETSSNPDALIETYKSLAKLHLKNNETL